MKIITEIKEANDLLQSYMGAKLQIAFYSESLKRIAIRIWLPHQDVVIYFVGVGCKCMNGNFTLMNANLYIHSDMNQIDEEITILNDRTSGFELVTSGGFSLVIGNESDFGQSFDDFFINKP